MVNYTKLSFEDGLNYVVDTILENGNKPVIVSIHGTVNVGKSELIKRVCNDPRVKGLRGYSLMRGDSLHPMVIMEMIKDYVLIEDMYHTEMVLDYSLMVFGKRPDLIVCMRRNFDNLEKWLKRDLEGGYYNLAIENPAARFK